MEHLIAVVDHYLGMINGWVWGPPMIGIIFCLGIYLTVKLRFIQRYTLPAIKLSIAKGGEEGMVSSFGSLSVMIGATVGTGSILGVTTAVAEGGPGALFWMLVAGFFNFAIKYGECMVAIKYRIRLKDGEYVGGPMYYLKDVLGSKWLAVVFALGTLLMGLTGGSSLQANAIADALREGYNLNPWYVGFFVAAAAGVVIIGGVKRIASYSTWLVPIMGGLYLMIALVVIVMNFTEIPAAVLVIIKGAFTGKAVFGGALGTGIMAIMHAMTQGVTAGVTRAVLATEAGMGSASMAAAAAQTRSPTQMAIVSATSVFWAIFICMLTGLVIVLAGDYTNPNVYSANLCNSAFKTVRYIGTPILISSLVIFSFTTIIGWGYYTEKSLQFLCKSSNVLIKPSRVLFVVLLFVGGWFGTPFSWHWTIAESAARTTQANISTHLMWQLAIFTMTMMTLPNVYALWRFREEIAKTTRVHLRPLVGRKISFAQLRAHVLKKRARLAKKRAAHK